MRIGLLGPLEVDERSTRLGTRDRVVLAALAMHPGDVLSVDQLADAVWGDEPPASWSKNLQGCISRLRKLLGPELIETAEQGYRLRVPADTVDAEELTRAAGRARELLTLGESEHARYVAGQALELWRGRPLSRARGVGAGCVGGASSGGGAAGAGGGRGRGRAGRGSSRRGAGPGGRDGRGRAPAGAAVGAAGPGAVPGRAADGGAADPAPDPGRASAGAGTRPRTRPGRVGAGDPASGPRASRSRRRRRRRGTASRRTPAWRRTARRTPSRSSAARRRPGSASSGWTPRGLLAVVGPVGQRQVLVAPGRARRGAAT